MEPGSQHPPDHHKWQGHKALPPAPDGTLPGIKPQGCNPGNRHAKGRRDWQRASHEITAGSQKVQSRSHFTHVQTRVKSPHTNGVVERWFHTLKYDTGLGPLYRHEIDTVLDLDDHVKTFITEYNQTRPHEAIGWSRPYDRYLQTPNTKPPKPEQDPRHGTLLLA